MASRKSYPCFKCRDNGFDSVMVYLAGQDEQGKTIQLEEDGTRHVHKEQQQVQQHEQLQQQQQQQQQLQPKGEFEEQAYLERVTDESVQRGITALKMFSDLAIQVDGTATECNIVRVNLDRVESKIDRLLSLVFAQQQQQQQKQHQPSNV
jgi:hypothetical protein